MNFVFYGYMSVTQLGRYLSMEKWMIFREGCDNKFQLPNFTFFTYILGFFKPIVWRMGTTIGAGNPGLRGCIDNSK